jgi:hypothetical protein
MVLMSAESGKGQGMKRPAICMPALAALVAVGATSGCTRNYGTGQAPEMALFKEVTGGLMSRGKKEPIAYQPRAPLVMPASREQLPAPAESAAAASPDWPVDPDQQVAENGEAYDPQAEYQRLKPLAGLMPESKVPRSRPTDFEQPAYDIVHSKKQQEQVKQAIAESKGYGRDERKFLTDPPTGYRAPAETAPAEFDNIKGSGGGGGFLRWIFNRG